MKKRIRVTGLVQGVGYRFFAVRKANQRGIKGYVKNLRDGSVEVVAVGNSEALRLFIEDLREGPFGADVRDVIVEDFSYDPEEYHDFRIRY